MESKKYIYVLKSKKVLCCSTFLMQYNKSALGFKRE